MRKCVETLHKQIMGVIFKMQNSQLLTWSLPTEEIFKCTAKIGLEKCHYQSHRIRNFRFFFPYFGFLPLLEKFKRPTNDLGLRMVKALPFIHQPDRAARKASGVLAADWRYQTRGKNTIFFHVCCYGSSQG